MIQVVQLQGRDQYLYQLLAPLVMDPQVIRANNNYPFKTSEFFVWYIAMEEKEVLGFIPIELKTGKKAVLNNYYINGEKERREEIFSQLLPAIIEAFIAQEWRLHSITLIQDKEIFEKYQFSVSDQKWTRYVKMNR